MMDADMAKNKDVEPVATVAIIEHEYFYPPQNGYQALAVRAATKQDADTIYFEKRKPVKPESAERSEDKTETNKE